MATQAKDVVHMYRRILKLAARYPSIKRDAIIRDIKLEFHENKALTDAAVIEQKVLAARAGIAELAQYAGLNPQATNWTVEMGRQSGGQRSNGSNGNVKVVGENKAE
ncbi:TPA: hypothetical protein N0F65_006131 [Lagenidium giganteum]|uniref:Complex 1 LYR protein domain-containing protein n=1 Tax=Lagenidium giganteum TaxID=4803 RepID=A0AAV2Z3S0_9STRA|nr:TPA: hypothetical protein N0F65_006131 [Lagenidium giganteum]